MRCLNNVLEDFFYRYAQYVIRYAYVFLLTPLAMTMMLSGGFYFLRPNFINDTEWLFTPVNGQYKYERRAFDEHFPLSDEFLPGQSFEVKHYFYIIATGRGPEHKNLLNNALLDEIDKLNRYILDELSVVSYDGLYKFTYREICLTSELACFENPHVQLLRHRDELEEYNNHIRYPVTRIPLDKPFYVAALLGSVELNDTEGRMKSVGAIRLGYYMKQAPLAINFYSIQFRDALQKYLLTEYRSNLIQVAFCNDESLNDGLEQNTKRYLPEMSVTVTLVFVFSLLCSFTLHRRRSSNYGPHIDWVRSKPLLAAIGVIEPLLAIASTIGFLLLVQCPFNDIVVVMPFIVFAIGVDDMFIMISAWHNTKFTDSAEKRFAEALSEAAVAITITSLSDIIAFSVGTWNPLPAIQMFCFYTAAAMCFELIYQCTFYAAALYLLGKLESEGLHCITLKKPKSFEESKNSTFRRWFCLGTEMKPTHPVTTNRSQTVNNGEIEQSDNSVQKTTSPLETHFEHRQTTDHDLSMVQTFFRNKFGPILLHPISKVLVGFLFAVYLGLSIWGSVIMPNGLQPEKLVPKDHYIHQFLLTDHFWNDGMQIQILVSNPPDVSVYENRQKLRAMVARFENTKHTLDGNYTMFWMREYERWLNQDNNWEDSPSVTVFQPKSIKDWLKFTGSYAYWRTCIEWTNATNASLGEDSNNASPGYNFNEILNNDKVKIKAFRFGIGLHDYAVPKQHQDAIVLVRSILDEFPEYNMTCYEHESPFVDQYLMIYWITIRNTAMSLTIMIFIAILLIPHPVCGIFMTLSVLSIDVGVSGFLCWWGIGMDCISMITMIMATGFAVDLSAHVSYAYVRAEGTANERAMKALETLGWPVFQGVTATFLGVLILGTVEAYMFIVFFKTVVLVILFGLLHSIVFLPVALSVFVPRKLDMCHRRSKVADNTVVDSTSPS